VDEINEGTWIEPKEFTNLSLLMKTPFDFYGAYVSLSNY
jgi:hypothetical protein